MHLDEPPLFGKGSTADTFESGTRSAICGGTTTVIPFAPQRKSEDSALPPLEVAHGKAKDVCYCDYSFHLLLSNPSPTTLGQFKALREQGISSLKIYMTYAALQLHDDQILDVLLEARRQRITTMIHAENGQVIEWMTRKLEEKRFFKPKYHGTSHPPMAEVEATYRAISLSEFIDTPILIVHVSSPGATQHIREAQKKGLPVYAETCPQYFTLTAADMDKPGFEGAKCVCSPPPRADTGDHDAIWTGLRDGTFTVLSSDHCPFFFDETNGGERGGKTSVVTKEHPQGRFQYIPNGIAGVETRLPLTLTMNKGNLPLQKVVEVTSTNPAKLYGLYPRKGALIPGVSDADLSIWYPDGEIKPFKLKNEILHHDCDYSPYEGREFTQWPRYTVLRGEVVWDRDNGGLVGKKGYGRFLQRDASCLAGSRSAEEWDIPE